LPSGNGLVSSSSGPVSARGRLLAVLAPPAIRARYTPLASALVTPGGRSVCVPATGLISRRRYHVRRLIPSASHGCDAESDRARYSDRVTIAITANASSADMSRFSVERLTDFTTSWAHVENHINSSLAPNGTGGTSQRHRWHKSMAQVAQVHGTGGTWAISQNQVAQPERLK